MKPSLPTPEIANESRENFPEGKVIKPLGLRVFLGFGQIVEGILSFGLWLVGIAQSIFEL